MKKKPVIKVVLIIFAIAAIALIAIGPVRLHKARKAVDEFAVEQGIDVKYEPAEEINSKETLLTEIWQLALWEEKTREKINASFGHTDKEYSTRETESKSGYEKEEELLSFAMKEKWRKLRGNLDQEVKDAVSLLFEKAGSAYGLNEQAVRTCYAKDYFGKITEVMQSVENGAGMEAYNLARYGLGDDWSALPMDMAYGLRPKLIMECIEDFWRLSWRKVMHSGCWDCLKMKSLRLSGRNTGI